MGNQTPAVIYVKYCNTNLYYNFIIKIYPYYATNRIHRISTSRKSCLNVDPYLDSEITLSLLLNISESS